MKSAAYEYELFCKLEEHVLFGSPDNDLKAQNDRLMFIVLAYTPVTVNQFIQMRWNQFYLPESVIYPNPVKYPKDPRKGYPICPPIVHELANYAFVIAGVSTHESKMYRGSRATLFRAVKRLAKETPLPNHWRWTPGCLKEFYYNDSLYREDAEDPEIFEEMRRCDFKEDKVLEIFSAENFGSGYEGWRQYWL